MNDIWRYTGLPLAISLAISLTGTLAPKSWAQAQEGDEDGDAYIETMQIIGHDQSLRRESGSATLIDELTLETFKFDDINRILYSVPGVNIREEDGYGLRPNIGFRGATPERSKKINIMEDGVLIGPAPYSAPSAYYFPMMAKITAVEVFKGPAAIQYGPNTVAGSLNLVTRPVPSAREGLVDIAIGSDGFAKLHSYYGDTIGNMGFLLEGIHLRADGFKHLDGGGDSGFDKNDLMAKFRYDLDGKNFHQVFELKLDYADEHSDETYLGLSDADFAVDPNRRYVASALDKMTWQHKQLQFTHFLAGESLELATRVYRNNFSRAWFKLNGFKGGLVNRSLQEILADPFRDDVNRDFYRILTGQQDSDALRPYQQLVLGNNDRDYFSQGIASDLSVSWPVWQFANQIDIGLRLHQDEIRRNHTVEDYIMRGGRLTDGSGAMLAASGTNTEKATAVSLYLQDTLTLGDIDITAGVRGELIDSRYQNRAAGEADDWLKKTTRIWLPSLSLFYSVGDDAGLFFGVHEGFLPTSPKQAPDISPESSVNYELGGRYNDGELSLELVGFFNDISNLKEGCQFSSCGSDNDTEFNGGKVDVLGVELTAAYSWTLGNGWEWPISLAYTYTRSEFKTSFDSGFDMWGQISAGDQLPYLPDHQGSVLTGIVADSWDVNLVVRYIGEMLEASGDGVTLSGQHTPALTVLDMSASYDLAGYGLLYLKADNLFDTQKIVSRRPFGARPGKPRMFQLGYQYRF
ncbi:TonB-dependent receptor [Shewanella sp. NFH-SH190041]|uniref:TonB-dependent receptor family protein n=1 Tax=Shewanella sp. NFH-SH190041 TaxID=2950245 RepID=UPI0021C3256D|nr:TonB-dependent receptor [Shewanella sp. NFH-SH190041]BDM63285.1 TonB-dependent receptor [Shewanella sp. NFH-SH190041]